MEARRSLLRLGGALLLAAGASAQGWMCKMEDEVCGYWGVALFSCCGGGSCGGPPSDMRCERPATCLPERAICGVAGFHTGYCCDGLTCEALAMGVDMRCAPEVPEADEDEGEVGGDNATEVEDVDEVAEADVLDAEASDGEAPTAGKRRLRAAAAAAEDEAEDETEDEAEDEEEDEEEEEEPEQEADEEEEEAPAEDGNATAADPADPADGADDDAAPGCSSRLMLCGEGRAACCGELQCRRVAGLDGEVCLRPHEFCNQEGEACEVGGAEDGCCGELQCVVDPLAGGGRCRRPLTWAPPATCAEENAICGSGPAGGASCCDGLTCRPVLGGIRMRCRAARECLARGAVCGFLGRGVDACCEGLSCGSPEGAPLMTCSER